MALVVAAVAAAALAAPASAAPRAPTAPYTVSVSPESLEAGSAGNTVTFRFTATTTAKGQVTIDVPAVASGSPWTAPQKSKPERAGYVFTSRQTCRSAAVAKITGTGGGPWKIVLDVKCRAGETFELTYGAGSGAGVTTATAAASYTFAARAQVGRALVDLAAQPVVTVDPGPARSLELTGLVDSVAGTEQSLTVTARDAFGNVATGYRGTVLFAGDPGASWDFPSLPTFGAADAGVRTFAVTAYTAGEQTLTATDTVTNAVNGSSAPVTISPGDAAQLDLSPSRNGATLLVGQTVRLRVTISAVDSYSNGPTDWDEPVDVTVVSRNAASQVVSTTEQTVVLENGTTTVDVDVAVVDTVVRLNLSAESTGITSAFTAFVANATQPNLDSIRIDANLDIPAPNPDGTFDGTLYIPNLNLHLDPNSIRIVGEIVSNTVPITALTVDGREFGGEASLTTPADPTTGTLVPDTTTIPNGTSITVTGCLNHTEPWLVEWVQFTIPGLEVDVRVATTPCRTEFWPVTTIPPATPAIMWTTTTGAFEPSAIAALTNLSRPAVCVEGERLVRDISFGLPPRFICLPA